MGPLKRAARRLQGTWFCWHAHGLPKKPSVGLEGLSRANVRKSSTTLRQIHQTTASTSCSVEDCFLVAARAAAYLLHNSRLLACCSRFLDISDNALCSIISVARRVFSGVV